MSVFLTGPLELKNQYEDDQVLQRFLKDNISSENFDHIATDLNRFGERVISDILEVAEQAEMETPRIKNDELILSPAWRKLHDISAEEGLISIGYQEKFGKDARIYQFAKKYLFNSSSAYFSCPLAMTDGALKLLKEYDPHTFNAEISHLLSNAPEEFWTSGQWMTEKNGGSDVSNTETIAKKESNQWKLYGTKWFTSAIGSEMALALAKPEGENKLQLFFVKLRDDQGVLNNIKILGLKNKMGTKALPTAELELQGTIATPIGEVGEGIKLISTQFNVTRIHNALECVSSMRRQLVLLKDYSNKRMAFGQRLSDLPLHTQLIEELEQEFTACFKFTFFAVKLLGVSEQGESREERENAEKLLRVITPLLKLFTAKKNISFSSEVIEAFGGVGYIEDSGIPKFLRDGQVLSIWEGTTNVLALDFLRAIKKEGAQCLSPWLEEDEIESLQNIEQKEARKVSLQMAKRISSSLQ